MRGLLSLTYLLSLVQDLSMRIYSAALCRSLLAAVLYTLLMAAAIFAALFFLFKKLTGDHV